MPRNVRNFWLEGRIEGRATKITGGPRRKDGGFGLDIYQRSNGQVIRSLCITGQATSDGKLRLIVSNGTNENHLLGVITTDR